MFRSLTLCILGSLIKKNLQILKFEGFFVFSTTVYLVLLGFCFTIQGFVQILCLIFRWME